MNNRLAIIAIFITCLFQSIGVAQTIDQVVASKTDLWGEEALNQPGGPTYDFFAKLLPPLRYVDCRFHVYPIVLSAPGALIKTRLVADGSSINARADQPNWGGEGGIPVTFRVGMNREVFGADPRRLDGPTYLDGYLPIVRMTYRQGDEVYAEEAFADVDPKLAAKGLSHVRFTLVSGKRGKIEAQFQLTPMLDPQDCVLKTQDGKILGCFDKGLEFNKARNTVATFLQPGQSVTVSIYTVPGDVPIDPASYDDRRKKSVDCWNALLDKGMKIDVPEAVVNNAWRSALIGSYCLLTGDEMRYSQGNAYAKLYIGEGTDATRSIAMYGHGDDAEQMMTPLFVYTRKNLEFHQAAFKLQMLAHCYDLSRDDSWIKAHRDLWEKELNVILNGREKTSGLLPREKYAGDIATLVFSLNSNANCWRALRDMSVVLNAIGETDRARELARTAAEYRAKILAALDHAVQRDVSPPFVPIALSGEEKPYNDIPEQRMGGYWNIMINYVLGSGVFPPSSEYATDIIHYLQQHGGLCMGMLKTHETTQWFYQADRKINDLYGMRYAMTLQARDEPDRALVSFYGKLAQGFTRNTFIDCEGSDIKPLDEFGRYMYLPPNSAGNANFLEQLRGLLVQDFDANDDGRADTLRLAFDTPRDWLADGKTIRVNDAPTDFGKVSFSIRSSIAHGSVHAEIDLPSRSAAHALLRFRLPGGAKVISAESGGKPLPMKDGQTIDLAGLSAKVSVDAKVGR